MWLTPNVGLAGSAYYVETTLTADLFGETGSIDTSVWTSGGRIVLGLGSAGPRSLVNLTAGLVANYTDYGDVIESSTRAAGVVGADLNVPLGANLGLWLGVDDYVHDVWFELDGVRTETQRQHDVVFFGGAPSTADGGASTGAEGALRSSEARSRTDAWT